MRRAGTFILTLLIGLAGLTWVATVFVHRTTRQWFNDDLRLRAKLAVTIIRHSLVSNWSPNRSDSLALLLNELTADKWIVGAAACNADLTLLAETVAYPKQFSCAAFGMRAREAISDSGLRAREAIADSGLPASLATVERLPNGMVHVSAVPVTTSKKKFVGFVVLVHDLGFAERREQGTREFMLLAFGVLAAAASGVTILVTKLSWRGWSEQVRRFLRGGSEKEPLFQSILGDVRELVGRIVAEKDTDGGGGSWTPQRLKQALSRYLHGEKIVIVANREPYIHQKGKSGGIIVQHPASGLVTALEPVMRACSGVWIAHGSGSADREASDRHGRVRVPPGEESYLIRRVWLSEEEEKGYYYGFSNEGLWPLCHVAHARPVFRTEDWHQYRAVNEKFVNALCDEVDSDDPIVLVQDYHFALAPRLIHQRLPRATVIMFWHIPWPNSERFGICPWREELLEGMLGSSIMGFHTQSHCNNFLESVDRFLEARLDREDNAVIQHGRRTLVRSYPISIEWPNHWPESVPSVAECRSRVFADLGLKPDAILGLGVDRLDYTKGVEERFLAVERLLEKYPQYVGRFTFIQLAAPSRTAIDAYRQLNETIEHTVERINERFANGGYRPIILLRDHHEPPTVFRYFRAVDLCYISSLHDGMNLVAKEFVAARDDLRGVLILSQFAGAAKEMTEALIVNPYDLDEASAAMVTAINMSPDEQSDRIRTMRGFLSEFNVYRWAGRMLVDAARLRSRDRLTDRLTDYRAVGAAVR